MYVTQKQLDAAKYSNSVKSVKQTKQSDNSMLYLSLAFAVGAIIVGLIIG